MVIRYRGTSPSLAVAKGSDHTRYLVRRWWCDILGDDTPQDTILFLGLIELLLEIHYLLTELTRDG